MSFDEYAFLKEDHHRPFPLSANQRAFIENIARSKPSLLDHVFFVHMVDEIDKQYRPIQNYRDTNYFQQFNAIVEEEIKNVRSRIKPNKLKFSSI